MRREFPPQCVVAEISAAGSSRYVIVCFGKMRLCWLNQRCSTAFLNTQQYFEGARLVAVCMCFVFAFSIIEPRGLSTGFGLISCKTSYLHVFSVSFALVEGP